MMKFYKYHALGNDYIVIPPSETKNGLTESQVRTICHRNFGVGSDGILYGPSENNNCEFGLRIFNPDGSEAEKSGNGLRIFSRFLWDIGKVTDTPFTVLTPGGKVQSQIFDNGRRATVDMGQLTFDSNKIIVTGDDREVINEKIVVDEKEFTFCAASIGNPHCVIILDEISEKVAAKYGPHIEKNGIFPNRINVQFMKILDRNNIQIEIWERGAGYTLASGSSSSAAAGIAYKLGYCDSEINVHMPGGKINISITEDYKISMTGSITKVSEGIISNEMFDKL